ncbi:cyanophycin synthetase [Sulfobacillus harzensis]|uniref:Cyanophycin synthetase n=1 Tax=Sulfobacillus harzensis TaxID=2729629 RepID=A0A7Y0L5Z6_9FIRM|nr:cyanophycin synthetase [Sulfobacillus harzensis]
MDIVSANFFPGPNRHVLRPCMEVLLDLGPYAGFPSSSRPHFIQNLLQLLPGLSEHHCSRGCRGGFVERLQEGTYLGHVVEHVALECLYLGGEQGVYGKTREADDSRVWIVFESETEGGGRAALELAIDVVSTLWDSGTVDFERRFGSFRNALAGFRLGPSTRAIWDACRRRGIPVARLDGGSLLRLGHGVRQRRVLASMGDSTSIVGVETAQDKNLAARLVSDAGLPVPESLTVTTLAEAELALVRMGGPLVIKPTDGHHGAGVMMNVTNMDQLRRGFLAARDETPGPIRLEQQIAGTAYRLLVVGSEMVAATERRVPMVVGDGRSSIRQLVEALNRDPRRGPDHGFPLSPVELDQEALETLSCQGQSPEAIPPDGLCITLRRTANMSTGATAHDVTAEIGPALARDAIRAAQAVGLDIAGVDVVTPRLDCSLQEAGGAIIEVNAAPGLRMHLFPDEGPARPVADRIVEHLFRDHNGRIPLAAITGTNGKTTVTRMLGHMGLRAGFRVGMCTTDGIAIGGELIKSGDLTGPWSARLVLNDPTVEMAVLETARGGMARGGLGFDDLDVAVVTNIGGDHLGQDGVETLEDLIHLKALIVDVVRPGGKAVLNADDPNVLGLADRCRGAVVLFSTASDNPAVEAHLATGGEAVYVKHGYLYYAQGDKTTRLIGTRALPASLGGVAAINVANAAAAAAAALSLGISPRQVAEGLKAFPAGGAGLNRGRLEMLQGDDIRVLVDYGHNVPAITALGGICRRLKPERIVTVLGLPGDRRNNDLHAAAQVVADFSHHVIIREDADLRGRAPGEVADIIRNGVLSRGTLTPDDVRVIVDEHKAVEEAVLHAPPGSLVLVLYERYGLVREAAETALQMRAQAADVMLEHA